jgi:hypothetical protein
VNLIWIHFIHVRKCLNKAHYFVQLVCANKKQTNKKEAMSENLQAAISYVLDLFLVRVESGRKSRKFSTEDLTFSQIC